MSALLPIINHLIQQNPEQQHALSQFAGKILRVNFAGLRIQGCITEEGFLESSKAEPDTELSFRTGAIQKLLQGRQPGVGDLSVSGDLMLGMSLLPVFGSLRYYANDDLARLFGDTAAGSLSSRAEQIGQTVRQIGLSLAEQIGEFSHEPESPVIDAETLEAWMDEVDRLRDDVARLNARLDRLERDIWID
ncbi:ubiquinone biosynthesis accessory factor UbiJ [Neisseria perflava]|uniref:ubiquinone biosynthesis accessory factor UbiJ n=1 Tax=Neisseria perflava TaxID=33053 RepID=UPI00209E2A75|nr:SCP2 sterol-binding domain-containing protein [Neisseria perflava]MCP1659820.1 ubiquinone biosynthesis protein UbiJ [Neisseria perflava]MCP1772635.1 ubiquinone biosynthesis protein UbiJ [Neisseria perflava]